jgi:hypothetical protein
MLSATSVYRRRSHLSWRRHPPSVEGGVLNDARRPGYSLQAECRARTSTEELPGGSASVVFMSRTERGGPGSDFGGGARDRVERRPWRGARVDTPPFRASSPGSFRLSTFDSLPGGTSRRRTSPTAHPAQSSTDRSFSTSLVAAVRSGGASDKSHGATRQRRGPGGKSLAWLRTSRRCGIRKHSSPRFTCRFGQTRCIR